MEKINEVLPVKATSALHEQTEKLHTLQSNAPIKINVPVNPSIETIGALCELKTEEDIGKDSENDQDYRLPKNARELILFEHNYAANLWYTFDSCKSEEKTLEVENSDESKNATQPENVTSTNVDEPELLNVSPPVRRSRRQIEKLEREQIEKSTSCISPAGHQDTPSKKEKLVAAKEKDIEKHLIHSQDTDELKPDLIDVNNSMNCHPNYKNFSEFKKRHLKVVILDCQNVQNKKIPCQSDVISNVSEKDQSSLTNFVSIDESTTSDKETTDLKNSTCELKSKVSPKKKVIESECVEADEKLSPDVSRLRKRRHLFQSNKCAISGKPIDSDESKVTKEPSPKRKTFSKTKSDKVEICLDSKKNTKVKHATDKSFEKDTDTAIQSGRRKKCVSFSDELISVSKFEVPARKRRISIDSKDSGQKLASTNSPTSTPVKTHKKKIIRRDSSRLTVDEAEPPLFSSPDVMVKVKTDDNICKKEEKDEGSSKKEDRSSIKESISKIEDSLGKKEDSSSKKEDNSSKKEDSSIKKEDNSSKKEDSSIKKEDDSSKKEDISSKKEDSSNKKEDIPSKKEDNSSKKEDSSSKKEDIPNKKEDSSGEKENSLSKKENDASKNKERFCKQEHSLRKKDSLDNNDDLNIKEDSMCQKVDSLCNKENSLEKKEEKLDVSNLSGECVSTTITTHTVSATKDNFQNPNDMTAVIISEELAVNSKHINKLNENNLNQTAVLLKNGSKIGFHNSNIQKSNCDSSLSFKAEMNSKKEICSSLHQVDFKGQKDEVTDPEMLAVEFHEEKVHAVHENGINSNDLKCANTDGNSHVIESDKNFVESGELSEDNPKPERKSRRLIKKKEFFGDSSNTSPNKKVENKKPSVEKDSGKKLLRRNSKTRAIEKDEDSDSMKSDSESEADSSEEDDPKKLWCICRKPHNSRFMIQCDKCEDWFHGSCVGVTKQYGRQLEKQKKEWNCPNCHMKVDPVTPPAEISSNAENQDNKVNEKPTTSKAELPVSQKICLDTNISHSSKHNLNSSITQKDIAPKCASVTEQNEVKKETVHSGNNKTSKKNLKSNVVKTSDAHLKSSVSPKISKVSGGISKSATSTKLSTTLKDVPQTKKEFTTKGVHAVDKTNSSTSKKNVNPAKEKKNLKRRNLNCIYCESEGMPNSCYCSNECIEKYASECLKNMRDSKEGPKGVDFDNQRLVVLDRLRGSVITSDHGPTAREIVSWLKSHPSYMIACSPGLIGSVKKDVQKGKESDASMSKKCDDDTAKTTVRLNVRKTLKNILLERCKNSGDIQMPEDDIQKIAVKIEEELQSFFKDNSFKYRAKYRSLMFNIKDPRNQGLFRKILTGAIQPDRLVRMSSEELASMELARWREQENQHLLDMIKRVQLEHQNAGSGLLLKKTHKGEVEIEDDMTNIIEQDVPKIVAKDAPEEVEPEKEMATDTTHLHRSHLFDLNCKICTGKIVPPPTDENVLKKVRVAHSITVDVSSSNTSDTIEKSVSKTVDGKSPVSSTGDDSMDQEPTSTVSIGSPDISIKSHSKGNKAKALSVWKGFIFMQDVAKFVTSAYKVSGQTDQLHTDLPDTVQVCGRIIPDQVWEYLGKIKQSGNKELIVIRFQAANEEEAVTYHSFYSYLSTRKRYGVVSNYSKKIKDFYILPLAATSPVPMVLVPFDGPGLPSPRPHLLLGVIVRHKLKQTSTPVAPKPPVSKTDLENIDGSYTPPHEPRSYTPPLPVLPSSNNNCEIESNSTYSPVAKVKDVSEFRKHPMCNKIENIKSKIENKCIEQVDIQPAEKSASVPIPIERDEDKPYDPEQDVLSIPSVVQKDKLNPLIEKPTSDNLESHIKILDALTRQVEETDRQVTALKELISYPEEDGGPPLPALNSQPLDISSIAESGMSSFLDLPETLQDIFNNVRLKTHDKDKETELGVNNPLKISFSKHSSEPKLDKTQHSIYKVHDTITDTTEKKYNSQATPPPIDDKNNNSVKCLSDPRIKLRTNFQDAFASSDPLSVSDKKVITQKQLAEAAIGKSIPSDEYNSEIPSSSSVWSSKEPVPPGLEFTDSDSQQNATIITTLPDNSSTTLYPASHLGPNSSSHVGSGFRSQPPPSFQTHLPPGFSVHTPPPNIKHFPPPPLMSTSFPHPPPMPMQVLPSEANETSLKESWQPLQLPKPQGTNPHWDQSLQPEMLHRDDSHYYPPGDSNDYSSESNTYKSKSSNTHWTRPSRFARGRWHKNSSGNQQDNQRRGRVDSPYRRNHRS